jgi:hypothetical protein
VDKKSLHYVFTRLKAKTVLSLSGEASYESRSIFSISVITMASIKATSRPLEALITILNAFYVAKRVQSNGAF